MSDQGGESVDTEAAGLLARTLAMEMEDVPSFHYAYNDIDSGADLVIQTNDDVLFRVHSFYLKASR
jgi:hypothetical protein